MDEGSCDERCKSLVPHIIHYHLQFQNPLIFIPHVQVFSVKKWSEITIYIQRWWNPTGFAPIWRNAPPPPRKKTSRDLRTYMRWPIFFNWAIYWRQKLPAGIAKSDETWFGACSFCCLGHQVHHTVENAFWEACSAMSLEARQRMPMAYHRCQLHNPIKFSWQLAIVAQMGCAIILHLVA